MSIKLITENIYISIYFICSIYSLYIFFNLKVLMDHPFKKITGVWGRWRTHLLLVVYENQRMISWSLYLCRLQGWNSLDLLGKHLYLWSQVT